MVRRELLVPAGGFVDGPESGRKGWILAPNDLITPMFAAVSTEMITIVSFIGGGTLLALIGSIGGFLHYRRERLLMHTERMKALELGRELPDDAETARIKAASQAKQARQAGRVETVEKSLATQCYSTTGYICGSGFVFAWLAGSNQAVAVALAAATGAVGVAGMICGTVLAAKSTESTGMIPQAKPRFVDPEAV